MPRSNVNFMTFRFLWKLRLTQVKCGWFTYALGMYVCVCGSFAYAKGSTAWFCLAVSKSVWNITRRQTLTLIFIRFQCEIFAFLTFVAILSGSYYSIWRAVSWKALIINQNWKIEFSCLWSIEVYNSCVAKGNFLN